MEQASVPVESRPIELPYAAPKLYRRSNSLFAIALFFALLPYAIDVVLVLMARSDMRANAATGNGLSNLRVLAGLIILIALTHVLFHIASFAMCVAARARRRSAGPKKPGWLITISTDVCYAFFIIDAVAVLAVCLILRR